MIGEEDEAIMSGSGRRASALALALVALALAPAATSAEPVPVSQVGSSGQGAGQLDGTEGVAVSPSGRIYVAELHNERISVFGPDGNFVHAFGRDVIPGGTDGFEVCTQATGCQSGDASGLSGGLETPRDIALDDAGHLFVADRGNDRISVFDTAGPSFLQAFGRDVVPGGVDAFEVCTSTCGAANFGDEPGALDAPNGVSVDGLGNLLVAENFNDRVSVFDVSSPATVDASFVHAFGWDVVPGNPVGPEVCTSGSDCQGGEPLGSAGALIAPTSVVSVGPLLGITWVAEAFGERISSFGGSGAFFSAAWGWNVSPAGGAGFETCMSSCQAGVTGGGAGQLYEPSDLALDDSGNLLVADRHNNRVSVFDASGSSFVHAFGHGVVPGGGAGFEVCTSSCQAAVPGAGPGQLTGPRGIASAGGAIWVSDNGNDRLQCFAEAAAAPSPCPAPGGSPPPSATTAGASGRSARCGGRAATLVGTQGPDRVRGTPSRDVIAGLGGRDRIIGLAGSDILCGGAGKDRLSGGAGNDLLLGGKAKDRLLAGAGRRDRCPGKRDAERGCER